MASASSHFDIEPLVPLRPTSRGPAPMRPRTRRNWTKWALLVGIVIALGTAAEIWQIHSANAVSYETVTVGRGQVQASVTATGTLNAVVDVQVGSQVSGNIIALYADFNTKVTKGQLVAQIDPQAFQTQVDQATAALASVHSGVLTARAQGQKAQSDLAGTMASEKGVESILAKDQANAVNATNQ
jgi:HlyD family secretion protein